MDFENLFAKIVEMPVAHFPRFSLSSVSSVQRKDFSLVAVVYFSVNVNRFRILCLICLFSQPLNFGIVRSHRSTTYVDAAYCYRPSSVVCRSVCRSVTVVSPAKMAAPIESRFGRGLGWAQGTMY